MPQQFAPLAERVIDAVLEANPGIAAFAGDHRFDDRLPDLSAEGVAHDVAMLHDASNALSQVDIEALDVEDAVDHAALMSLVERMRFELTEVREHEWNPLDHNPGSLLYGLMARPFAAPEQRLQSLAGRLAAIPDALATARSVLGDCPRIHLETAVGQFLGTAALVRGEVPGLLKQAPALTGTVTPAQQQAVAAIEEFVGWLRQRLDDAAEGGRDPRLGRRTWEARLWHTLDTELPAAKVLAKAEANLNRVTDELRAAAAALVGGPATDETVRTALDRLADERPDNTSIVDLAKVALDEATTFVREHDLVGLIDDPCVIMEMPEFARGVAVAYCDPPGPLETADVPTFYCIAPTPADWSAQRVESFYREYNNHMLRNLTVHEAMPGHFLQLAHSRRFRGSTRARALGFSGPFVEGWAVYTEEVMVEHGFGGLPVRLQQLKAQLRTTINAIIDQLVHCEGLSEVDAMAMMMHRGFQEEGEAAGKWRRALLTSTQLSTYFVGYAEVSAIGRARPPGTSVREWHDTMLAHGSPAPRHVRILLGV
jgi:phage tail protein X